MHWTATYGMFGVTLVLALITLAALHINYLLLAAHTGPQVIVYSTSDESRPSIILLIIENVGKGVAKDVTFKASERIPCKAYGLTIADAQPPRGYDLGPLRTGIPALAPGARRVMVWGQFGGLYKALENRAIRVTAEYSAETPVGGLKRLVTTSLLEAFSYDATDAVDPDGARQSAKQLKRIADVAEQAVRELRARVTPTIEADPSAEARRDALDDIKGSNDLEALANRGHQADDRDTERRIQEAGKTSELGRFSRDGGGKHAMPTEADEKPCTRPGCNGVMRFSTTEACRKPGRHRPR
jgi:hypothetical protein